MAVAEAMKVDATVESVIESMLEFSSKIPIHPKRGRFCKETVGDFIRKAVDVARKYGDVFEVKAPLYKEALGYHAMDPVEVLALTFTMVQVSKSDVGKVVIGGANIGRDSDTISRLGGSICGALRGIEAVPQDLLQKVEKVCIMERMAAPYMDKPLAHVAEELAEAVKEYMNKLESNLNQMRKLL